MGQVVNARKPPQCLPGNQHTCPQSCTSKQCFLEHSLSVWNSSRKDGTYIVVADTLRRACGGEAFPGELRVCAPQLSPLSGLPQVISLTTLRVSRPSCAKGKRSACISASNCTACSRCHAFQRETAAPVVGRNVVLDRLSHSDRRALAFPQLLEQTILLQFGDHIDRHIAGIGRETPFDLLIAFAPRNWLIHKMDNGEHTAQRQEPCETRQDHSPLHPVQALARCDEGIGWRERNLLSPAMQPADLG